MAIHLIPGVESRPWLELGSGPLYGSECIEKPYQRWPRGWVLVWLGKGHPLALASGYQRRARLVLHFTGLDIPSGFEVDHRDGDKRNDHPDNLRVARKADHARRHVREKKRRASGKWIGS